MSGVKRQMFNQASRNINDSESCVKKNDAGVKQKERERNGENRLLSKRLLTEQNISIRRNRMH